MPTGLPDSRDYSAIPGTSPVTAKTFNNIQDCIVSLKKNQAAGEFGDGFDGDVTLDGVVTVPWATLVGTVYTLSRDFYCKTLILTGAGVVLKVGGAGGTYRGYCKTKFKTIGGAYADCSGGDAALQVAGVGCANGTILGIGVGSNGTNGNGVNQAATGQSYGGTGGDGGTSLSLGGTGGLVTPPSIAQGNPHTICGGPLLGAVCTPTQGIHGLQAGGPGGSGGGGGTVNVGGGSGAPGGVFCLAARKIELESANDIRARGGKGGDCTNSSNSGGGGGGGGGTAILVTESVTVGSGTLNSATVCAGGAPGLGSGPQAPAATAGTAGTLFLQMIDVEYIGVVSDAAPVPTMLPDTYVDAALPDPSTFKVNSVIVNRTTNQILITYDQITWTALS